MKKSIEELGHDWRYTLYRDYIEIDRNDFHWRVSFDEDNKTTYCKVLHYKDGTPYIRYNGDSYIIEEEQP